MRRGCAGAMLGRLEYLYVGSRDVAADLAYYRDVLGGEVVWDFEEFGTRVSCVRLSDRPPLVVLAGHRPAPSVLPIFAVDDLPRAEKALRARGWRPEGPSVEVPDGPCYLFKDPSGNELALLGQVRPHVLERA
jgi:catechol 2,3-dioxygenase-like lactoylglutathione lyase family enzyme